MLDSARLVAFVPTLDLERATQFYGGPLGLTQVDGHPGAAVFDCGGTQLRVTVVNELEPDPFTVLGWDVDDIATAVDQLIDAGVDFTRYDGMGQDERGVWRAPGGALVAWFRDPDGNTLSFSQPA